MEKLFEEFNSVDQKTWEEKILKDLKGKPAELLSSHPEEGIEIKAAYHQSEKSHNSYGFTKSPGWTLKRNYTNPTSKEILKDLNEGINHIGLHFDGQENFDSLTKDILFEHIKTDLTFGSLAEVKAFKGHSSINKQCDLIGQSLMTGSWLAPLTDFAPLFETGTTSLFIDGKIYGECGASTIQETAFILAHLNEYIHILSSNGIRINEIQSKLSISISVQDNFFLNVAKIKVIRHLIANIFKAYDPNVNIQPIQINAESSVRHLTVNDKNNNLLRQTTQAMSAIIGGCDSISINTIATDKDRELYLRMAKNIPLILQEESYLDKVVDPSEGSYYVQQLCDQLSAKSWELFQKIEKTGGLIENIQNDFIQTEIDQHKNGLIEKMNKGESTFLGINKFPSTLEDWQDVASESAVGSKKEFTALSLFRLEKHFKKSVHEQN